MDETLLFEDFDVLLPTAPLKPSCRRCQGIDKNQTIHPFYNNNLTYGVNFINIFGAQTA